jgi:hypothetical protein
MDVRPPLPLFFALLLPATLACTPASEPQPRAAARPLKIQLDERVVLVGDVVERLDAEDYVYLRLAIVSDSARQDPSRAQRSLRWVALDGRAPSLGERVRVRSLARRTRVWAPQLERDFETLEYVALLPPSK